MTEAKYLGLGSPRRAIPPGSSSQPERSYPFHEHGLCLLHRIGFDTPEDLVAAASHNFGLLGVGREDGPFVALGPVPSEPKFVNRHGITLVTLQSTYLTPTPSRCVGAPPAKGGQRERAFCLGVRGVCRVGNLRSWGPSEAVYDPPVASAVRMAKCKPVNGSRRINSIKRGHGEEKGSLRHRQDWLVQVPPPSCVTTTAPGSIAGFLADSPEPTAMHEDIVGQEMPLRKTDNGTLCEVHVPPPSLVLSRS